MIFSVENLIQSIADQLGTMFEYTVYDSPTQDTNYPCFYVFVTLPSIENELSGWALREIGFDVVFVQQRNAPAQNAQLYSVLETLDGGMDMLTYTAGGESVLIHINDRNASIEDQELHYKFTIRQRVSTEKLRIYMQEMEEENVEVTEG